MSISRRLSQDSSFPGFRVPPARRGGTRPRGAVSGSGSSTRRPAVGTGREGRTRGLGMAPPLPRRRAALTARGKCANLNARRCQRKHLNAVASRGEQAARMHEGTDGHGPAVAAASLRSGGRHGETGTLAELLAP